MKFQVAMVALEITMQTEEIASIVMIIAFGSINVIVWEFWKYIDNNKKVMNSELAKFAVNKIIHLNFIL
jgi:hypothetical protein